MAVETKGWISNNFNKKGKAKIHLNHLIHLLLTWRLALYRRETAMRDRQGWWQISSSSSFQEIAVESLACCREQFSSANWESWGYIVRKPSAGSGAWLCVIDWRADEMALCSELPGCIQDPHYDNLQILSWHILLCSWKLLGLWELLPHSRFSHRCGVFRL